MGTGKKSLKIINYVFKNITKVIHRKHTNGQNLGSKNAHSDFQKLHQGRYLIKNTEIEVCVFDISNTTQSNYGLAPHLGMT